MRIKEYEKPNTKPLHVTGVDAPLVDGFAEYCKATGAPQAHFMNQMLSEFMKAVEAKPKTAVKSKAVSA